MGFRILRGKSKLERQKSEQLSEELMRWKNLTAHSDSEKHHLRQNFEQAMEKAHSDESLKRLVTDIQKHILKQNANIALVQGNLEIDRIKSLLP